MDQALAAQLALLSSLIPLAIMGAFYLWTRRRGYHNPTNRPGVSLRTPMTGISAVIASVVCAVPVILGFMVPLGILVNWAIDGMAIIRLDSLPNAIVQTLLLAGSAALLGASISTWMSLYARSGSPQTLAVTSTGILALNYAFPAIALAIGILVITSLTYPTVFGGWIADSMLLVFFAAVLRYSIFAFVCIDAAMRSTSRRLDEAVLCAGRSRTHGIRKILLPLLRVPIASGALLVFLLVAREVDLALVLQPFGYQNLALSIYHFADIDLYPAVAIHALCLAAILAYPVMSLNRWLGGR
jgi:iron(III) transport system permease protein